MWRGPDGINDLVVSLVLAHVAIFLTFEKEFCLCHYCRKGKFVNCAQIVLRDTFKRYHVIVDAVV